MSSSSPVPSQPRRRSVKMALDLTTDEHLSLDSNNDSNNGVAGGPIRLGGQTQAPVVGYSSMLMPGRDVDATNSVAGSLQSSAHEQQASSSRGNVELAAALALSSSGFTRLSLGNDANPSNVDSVIISASRVPAPASPTHLSSPLVQTPSSPITDLTTETNILKVKHMLWESQRAIRQRDDTIKQLQGTVRELAVKLHGVAQFVDMKEDVEERITVMQKKYDEDVLLHRNAAREAKLEMLENRVKLRSIEEELRQTHERNVMVKATQLLDKRTREVNEQNFDLVKDKVLLAKDMEVSRERTTSLEQHNTTLRREMQLAKATEEELISRSVKQRKEIVDLKRQVKIVEDNLDSIVRDYEQRIAKEAKAHELQVATLIMERDSARRDAKQLHGELSRLRAASSAVLAQRADLEVFFHEALTHVRGQIIEERRRGVLGLTCGTGNNAAHTTSSTLRLETQMRLMLTDNNGNSTESTRSSSGVGGRRWGTDRRGFPVLLSDSEERHSLPPIPLGTTSPNGSSGYALVRTVGSSKGTQAVGLRGGNDGGGFNNTGEVGEEDGGTQYFEDTRLHGHALFSMPSPPSAKELQEVKISQMSWNEKERVIRNLFKRIQQQQQLQGKRAAAMATQSTAADAVELSAMRQEVATQDSSVFLTQQ